MKTVEQALILEQKEIAPGIFDLTLSAPAVASAAAAGQFVEVHPDDGAHLLPRPISICGYNKKAGTLRLVYQVVGEGTALFSKKKAGDTLRIMGPLGHGFTPAGNKHILIGGGIGVPPLLQLAKELEGEKEVFLGFRSVPILTDEFTAAGAKVHIATDDGSVGYHGTAVALAKMLGVTGSTIYSCGPKPMLKAVADFSAESGIPAQVSMEERMACGFGVCVGCVVKIKDGDGFVYKKACKDGPVFSAEEVYWE